MTHAENAGAEPRDRTPRSPGGADGERAPQSALLGMRRWTWIWLAMLVTLLIWSRAGESFAVETIPYSEFQAHLSRGEVEQVQISDVAISGALVVPAEDSSESLEPRKVEFRSVRVEDPELVQRLEAAGVPFSGVAANPWVAHLLTWLLPLGLLLGFFALLTRGALSGARGQLMGFGKSRAKLAAEEGTGVTFEDVAGCDEAKQELNQMVEFLREPSQFTRLGGHIPKGVLLLGPPGTGKTLLARAIAGEAGVPFFSLTGSDFVELFVGVGASRVRDLFEQAKAKAPCIVFIDEIDAIGRQRGVSMGVVNDEREQTLNQLLSEMDGFENNSGVILLAATNRPEILDRALLRPGRFDRQVVLDSPDVVGREAILRVHARGKPLADDVDFESVARITPGMAGADLSNVMNEAALSAAERRADSLTQRDLLEAVEKVVAGPERRSRRLEPEEKRRVAVHESGHALVATRVAHGEPVQKITIVPRGRAALGYTMQLPEQEHYLRTKSELDARLVTLLAGRAAEELVLQEPSTGAHDDLRTATDIAREMICVFGMSERIGLAHCARNTGSPWLSGEGSLVADCSDETLREVDEEVHAALDDAFARAREVLESERELLDRLSAVLLERETLDRAAFEELVHATEGDRSAADERSGHDAAEGRVQGGG